MGLEEYVCKWPPRDLPGNVLELIWNENDVDRIPAHIVTRGTGDDVDFFIAKRGDKVYRIFCQSLVEGDGSVAILNIPNYSQDIGKNQHSARKYIRGVLVICFIKKPKGVFPYIEKAYWKYNENLPSGHHDKIVLENKWLFTQKELEAAHWIPNPIKPPKLPQNER